MIEIDKIKYMINLHIYMCFDIHNTRFNDSINLH